MQRYSVVPDYGLGDGSCEYKRPTDHQRVITKGAICGSRAPNGNWTTAFSSAKTLPSRLRAMSRAESVQSKRSRLGSVTASVGDESGKERVDLQEREPRTGENQDLGQANVIVSAPPQEAGPATTLPCASTSTVGSDGGGELLKSYEDGLIRQGKAEAPFSHVLIFPPSSNLARSVPLLLSISLQDGVSLRSSCGHVNAKALSRNPGRQILRQHRASPRSSIQR